MLQVFFCLSFDGGGKGKEKCLSRPKAKKKKKGDLKTIIQRHKWSIKKKKKGTIRRNKRQLYYNEKKKSKRFIDGNEAQYVDIHTHTHKKKTNKLTNKKQKGANYAVCIFGVFFLLLLSGCEKKKSGKRG